MFQTPPTAFFHKRYNKTKKDLLVRPLMVQLQTCSSPTDILTVLRIQVQQFEQSTCGNDKLINRLDPTANVLYVFSEALGTSVGLVSSNGTILLQSNIFLGSTANGIFLVPVSSYW